MSWQSQVIALLAASLLRPFVLVGAAWLLVFVFRVRHPASRHAVWTAVLIGMLLLPFMSVIVPEWKLPVLPRKHDSALQSRPTASGPGAFTNSAALPPLIARASVIEAPARKLTFEDILLWCYLAGVLAMTAYRVMGWTLLRRVVSRSKRLRAGPLRESSDVVTPVAAGILHPAVILPIEWRRWNSNTRRAVLAHEFAHIRRKDALVLAFGRLARCVLWFHPLAWWVTRKLSNLAELACDAAVLERMNDPAGYTRILIEFASAANRAGRRVTLPGLAMAADSGMGQRIDQVFEISSGNLRKLARPGVVLALMGVPVMCLAATVVFGESAGRAEVRSNPVASSIPPPATVPVAAQIPARPQSPAPPAPRNTTAAVPSQDMPISPGLASDYSGSMRDNSAHPQDQIFVVNFDDAPRLEQAATIPFAQVQIPPRPQAPAPTAPRNTTAAVPSQDLPILLGLVIDNSGSMRDKRAKATGASLALVNSAHPQDQIFVVNFDDAAYLEQPFTSDKQKIEAAIRKAGARGGSAMWDAISGAIDYSKSNANETKALVVITDGDDNSSRHSMRESIKTAQDSGIPIYGIGLLNDDEPDKRRIAERALSALSKETGGMAFYPKDQADLNQILVQLEREIRDRAKKR